MPFLNFGGNKISIVICLTWISLWKIGTLIRIPIHFGTGSGSTSSKCGSEDPDPLLRKGGSEDPDLDPLFPNVDPRIRIHVWMRWIWNAVYKDDKLPISQNLLKESNSASNNTEIKLNVKVDWQQSCHCIANGGHKSWQRFDKILYASKICD